MAIKKYLISGQPKYADLSQYNFEETLVEENITYVNSNSLPENSDKFQEKDLNTTIYGSSLNEKIINRNLFFSGSSFIKINNLKIDNTGVNYKVKNIKVEAYFFSRKTFVNDTTNSSRVSPLNASYNQLVNTLNKTGTEYQIYSETFSRRNKKKGLGNIENLEGVEIVGNMNDTIPSLGDLPGSTFNISSLELEEASSGLIDNNIPNALYIAVWMRGDAKRWFGTDKRKRRLQVFEINNLELFDSDGNGRHNEISFDNASHTTTGGGGRGGAEAAAFKVTSFRVVINTSAGITSGNVTEGDAVVMKSVLPSQTFTSPPNYTVNITSGSNLYTGKFSSNFLLTSPNRQLINSDSYGTSQNDVFPNYFPLTHIRVVETIGGLNNDVIQNESDLQTYHNDIQSINTSVPSNIGFSLQMVNPTDFTTGYPQQDLTNPTDDNPVGNYLYFVIDWDDVDDKFKSIDDYLDNKPETLEELQDRQSNNLYIFRNQIQNGISGLNAPILNNLYITPGIKTIKIIVFSYDEINSQTGRWKLIKSRFYLNEPLHKYPDFGDVGGSDYATLPWPYTTPIIGGVDENSKYKKSVQNTLSSGKISNTDIIDEELLTKDLENDELGKSINKMDLEQCRYFNQSYNMNTLLNIEPIQQTDIQYEEDLQPVNYFFNSSYNDPDAIDYYGQGQEYLESPEFLATLPFPQYREEFDIDGNGGFNINDTINWGLQKREDIALLINYLANAGIPFPSQFTYPDYISSWTTTDDIPSAVIPIGSESFKPYNYIVENPNEIEDVFFEDVNHNNYNIINKWHGELESSGNRTGTDLYEQKKYNDDSRGIHIKYTADDVSGNTWTFFKYKRQDLHNNLKTYEEGGTEYTFEVDIRFNEFSARAPRSYIFRAANRDNDYGYSYRQGDFKNGNLHFYRGDDGVYSENTLQNKLANYGDWITIKETRKLISNYSSSRTDGYVDGFPNMEFLTNNWNDTFSEDLDGDSVIDFDIRNPIMLPTEIYEETTDNLLNQNRIYWDGQTNKYSEESSVGQIFIGDNSDLDLKQSCKLEINTGELTDKSIYDSSGNSNKGLLIGDYKVKKQRKGERMTRDSFIKVPKKTGNTEGAL